MTPLFVEITFQDTREYISVAFRKPTSTYSTLCILRAVIV